MMLGLRKKMKRKRKRKKRIKRKEFKYVNKLNSFVHPWMQVREGLFRID
jgi:hypothetical protein